VPELKSSGCPRKCAAPAGFFAPAAEAAAEERAEAERGPINYLDGARRIAFLFREAYKEIGKPMPDNFQGQITGLLAAETPKTESDAGDG
jgi:hypothetical protein